MKNQTIPQLFEQQWIGTTKKASAQVIRTYSLEKPSTILIQN